MSCGETLVLCCSLCTVLRLRLLHCVDPSGCRRDNMMTKNDLPVVLQSDKDWSTATQVVTVSFIFFCNENWAECSTLIEKVAFVPGCSIGSVSYCRVIWHRTKCWMHFPIALKRYIFAHFFFSNPCNNRFYFCTHSYSPVAMPSNRERTLIGRLCSAGTAG